LPAFLLLFDDQAIDVPMQAILPAECRFQGVGQLVIIKKTS
jgi:hypothetical protein